MTVTAIVGAQWGDEGKGHIVDYMAAQADLVIRYQGGDNAGHTVVNDYGRFALHLVPCGIFYPNVYNLIGPGTVVNLDNMGQELGRLRQAGVDTHNIHIDLRAHLIMPYHCLLDGAAEEQRKGSGAGAQSELGTTRRGIGPAYADKHSYQGIRVGDLLHPDVLRQRLTAVLPLKNHQLAFYGQRQFTVDELMEQAAAWKERYGHLIVDSLPVTREAIQGGRNILLEGQLGVGRCVDWGIYPYSTASSPTAGAACAGAGIPPRAIDAVMGVVKAYSSSVGGGPFPTELHDEWGARLQGVGAEFGATTGRQRRCGWFDGVLVRQSSWLNGFTGIAVTKLDVLDGFETIKLCTAYRLEGREIDTVPDTITLAQVEPVYETWPGWQSDTSHCRSWDELPPAAQAYLRRIEEFASAPIRLLGLGPERSRTVAV